MNIPKTINRTIETLARLGYSKLPQIGAYIKTKPRFNDGFVTITPFYGYDTIYSNLHGHALYEFMGYVPLNSIIIDTNDNISLFSQWTYKNLKLYRMFENDYMIVNSTDIAEFMFNPNNKCVKFVDFRPNTNMIELVKRNFDNSFTLVSDEPYNRNSEKIIGHDGKKDFYTTKF